MNHYVASLRDVANAVSGARSNRNWTQGELAEAAGVARKTVNEIEGAVASPSFESVVRICTALELHLLVTDTGPFRLIDLDDLLRDPS